MATPTGKELGTIVVQNLTTAGFLNYAVHGSGGGAQGFGSGQLGTTSSGTNRVEVSVSGYDQYQVSVGPIGPSESNASVLAKVDQQVSFGTSVD